MKYNWQRTANYVRAAEVSVSGYGDAQAVLTKIAEATYELMVYGDFRLVYQSPIYRAKDFDAALAIAAHYLEQQFIDPKEG